MKKLITVLFIILFTSFSFAGYFEDVNKFAADVEEETLTNKEKKTKKYHLRIEFPDKVYKEIFFPELNLGEKYYYDGENKKTFYPILEEVVEEKMDESENAILKTLKDIKIDKNEIIKHEKNGELEKIIYEDGYEVQFYDYKIVNTLNFPHLIKVYENGYLISELKFTNIKINDNFSFEGFQLNE